MDVHEIRITDDGWSGLPSVSDLRKRSEESIKGFTRYSPELRARCANFAKRILQGVEHGNGEWTTERTGKNETLANLILELMQKTGSWPADAFYKQTYCHVMCECKNAESCGWEVCCKPFWKSE